MVTQLVSLFYTKLSYCVTMSLNKMGVVRRLEQMMVDGRKRLTCDVLKEISPDFVFQGLGHGLLLSSQILACSLRDFPDPDAQRKVSSRRFLPHVYSKSVGNSLKLDKARRIECARHSLRACRQ